MAPADPAAPGSGGTPAPETPGQRMARLGAGTRVVVRYLIDSGATDALGTLVEVGADGCIVDTRRGPIEIPYRLMVAAKEVPPPPVRRVRPASADSSPPPPTA